MNTDVDESKGHIFISYQWSNQRTLIDVRNELHKQGFKVCSLKYHCFNAPLTMFWSFRKHRNEHWDNMVSSMSSKEH